ncbi:MAG: hypothetical protein WCK86_23305, partial [Planctomycetia bacterium]
MALLCVDSAEVGPLLSRSRRQQSRDAEQAFFFNRVLCQSLKLRFTVIPAQAGIQIAALVSR